jgi:hypothetical protein
MGFRIGLDLVDAVDALQDQTDPVCSTLSGAGLDG